MDLTLSQTVSNLGQTAPELTLTVAILGVILFDLFQRLERSHRCGILALIGLGLASWHAVNQWNAPLLGDAGPTLAFSGTYAGDHFALFFKLLFYPGTAVVVIMSMTTTELWRVRAGEYYALLLTGTLASSFLVSSTNWLMIYLSFETLSLPSYVLAGYRKGDRQAA